MINNNKTNFYRSSLHLYDKLNKNIKIQENQISYYKYRKGTSFSKGLLYYFSSFKGDDSLFFLGQKRYEPFFYFKQDIRCLILKKENLSKKKKNLKWFD